MSPPRYPYVHVHVSGDTELVSDQLWILGAQGIEERDEGTMNHANGCWLVASFADDDVAHEAANALASRDDVGEAKVEYVVGDEWRDGWREFFKPTAITPRIFVRPSWENASAPAGAVTLVIDPGNAFGSGLHETTRLVLAEIDERVRVGQRVLDVGCGSGILSIAALLLGAEHAVGTDTDPNALETSQENTTLNGVGGRMTTLPAEAIETLEETFPLVLANIQAHVLIPMAPTLMARVQQGGTLVLSGVLDERCDEVVAAYDAMELLHVRADGEWRAIVLTTR